MTLIGETIATGGSDVCPDCKIKLVPRVLQSAAGFYIGTACECGPYSRESDYFKRREDAQKELDSGTYGRT
jgi:hypothetical protein